MLMTLQSNGNGTLEQSFRSNLNTYTANSRYLLTDPTAQQTVRTSSSISRNLPLNPTLKPSTSSSNNYSYPKLFLGSWSAQDSGPSPLMNGLLGNAPLSVMFVRALYDYKTDDLTSLSFREGDVIQVITQLDSGWWDGIIKGVRGWFPSNYCHIIRSPEYPAIDRSNTEDPDGEIDDIEGSEVSEEYEDHYEDDEADSELEDHAKLPNGRFREAKNQTRADFWIPQATPEGRVYYFNTDTGESSTELPVESPVPDEKNPRDHLTTMMPEMSKVPPEWRARRYSQSETNHTERILSQELEGDNPKVPHKNYHSRQRSRGLENISSSTTTKSIHDNLTPMQSRRDLSVSEPSSITIPQSTISTIGTIHAEDLCQTFLDDSLSTHLTWNRLVANMTKAVDKYRDAIKKNERSEYVRRAEDISDHLRLLLAAGSGTTDNHSGQPSIISTNKALYPHFRDMMSKFSKLVISSHIAAADWPNVESYQKCLQEAEGVLQGVFCYVEVARKQRGEKIPRLLPGFINSSITGGNWQNNGLGTRDPLNTNFMHENEGLIESLVTLDAGLIDHLDETKRVLVSYIRKLEENLILTDKIITPLRHEIIGNSVCTAATKVLGGFKTWISTVESIDLSPLAKSSQNPQLNDFAALKQGLYDSVSDLLISCQAVAGPLGDEWAEMRGEPLEARLTHVRLSAKLLETKTSQVGFSLQLLGEQIQMAQVGLHTREDNGRSSESRRTDNFQFTRSHHTRTDSRMNAVLRSGITQNFTESDVVANSRKAENSKVRKFFGEEPSRRDPVLSVRSEQPAVHIDETPDCLRLDHEDEISYDLKTQPPQLKGGTLVALVEQLTRHDKLDSNFNNTFLLTYRSFTTARDLFVLLAQRFQIQPPNGISLLDFEVWRDRKQKPIRFRVVNILKSWFDNFWMEDQSEETKSLIRDVYTFARETVKTTETPGSTPLMSVLEQRLRGHDTTAKRLILNMSQTTPQPIMPKNMKKLKFLDIDPTEFARQLTIIESKLYGKIKPTECLNKTWQKKVSEGEPEPAPNVKALILHANQLTNWVAEIILTQADVKKRVVVIKHFVQVADKCRQLNNYSTLTSIISALGTAPILRLKRTWDQIPAKTLAILESMRRLMLSTKNFCEYRETLHLANPPCLPFFGVYLTDLTFIEDGIPSTISKSALINFAKRAKTAEIIRDIQQSQNVPYALQSVSELQEYILCNMQAAGDVHEMYEKSLAVEPREREDEKIVRVLAESGFL